MKKVFILIISLLILSCGARKKERLEREKTIQKIFDYSDFVVHYPENWTYNLGHGLAVYKPKGFNGTSRLCMIEIFKGDEPILNTLVRNVDWRTSENEKKIKPPQKVKTKFGIADLYVITFIYDYWIPEPREVTATVVRFKHNNETYNLRYTAEKKYFQEYRNVVDYFIENLEFKE